MWYSALVALVGGGLVIALLSCRRRYRDLQLALEQQQRLVQRLEASCARRDTINHDALQHSLAHLSHELRTPLNTLNGYLQLLRQETQGERSLAWWHQADSSIDHLLKLLNQLLDPAKIEAGKWELEPQPLVEVGGRERSESKALLQINILVVDDNPLNREVAEQLLRRCGAIVTSVDDGQRALALLQQGGAVDLILMDIQMPNMDGYSTTSHIRQLPHCRDIPVIAMSAHAHELDRERSLACGMVEHISKPFHLEQLIAAIDYHVVRPSAIAEGSEGEATLPLLNRALAVEQLGGMEDIWCDLAQQYLATWQLPHQELQRALQQQQRSRARQLSHRLAGSAAMIGLKRLEHSLRQIESQMEEEDHTPPWRPLLEELQQSLALSINALQQLLERS